jgi:hypothetical protein
LAVQGLSVRILDRHRIVKPSFDETQIFAPAEVFALKFVTPITRGGSPNGRRWFSRP